ncbi:MAG: lysophospholipid acyltransferase family protein [Nitriliruptorales bacterium]|nr:lysophospholipid acyltransferase family protein [Nitriliruptorales bacterium]
MAGQIPDIQPQTLNWFWRLIRRVAELVVFGQAWRVDVEGLEHVPRTGGAVLAFNHHSYFDFVMVAWNIVRKLKRPVRFLAKREIWQSKAGPIIRLAKAVPVDRTDASSRHNAYDAAIASLAAGDLLAVAPEQTISPSFQLLPFRTGAARMAQQAGVPIVPVVGWGTQRFAAKGHGISFKWRLPVMVRYGPPMSVGTDDDPKVVTERLQHVMEAMLAELQESYPDRPTPGDDWWLPASLGGSAPPHADVLAAHQARFEERHGNPADHDQSSDDAA